MRASVVLYALCAPTAGAFAPVKSILAPAAPPSRPSRHGASSTAVRAVDLATSLVLADAVDGAMTAAQASADVAAATDGGWFGGFVSVIEDCIKALHRSLGEGSYGAAIILFTLLIKSVTFPLNYAQIESTTKMQALSPAIKKIQAKYANDPQQMNVMMAELYQENELNPLAGCLPSFAQIPIFIALYRALLNLAKEDALEESFLWLPNLEGPTYGAQNSDWLLKFADWNGGTPPLGWHDTGCYLLLPVLLVVAQSISANLLKPAQTGPESEQQQQTNAILKYLPLLVGVFSLNVPSGLTLYWFVNNIFTTASTVYIRGNVGPVTMGGAGVDAQPGGAQPKQKQVDSFDAMMAAKPAPKTKPIGASTNADVSQSTTTTLDAEVDVEAADQDQDQADESKAAAKRKQKAVKTRRSKKSRK